MADYAKDKAMADEIAKAAALLNVNVLNARLAGLNVILLTTDELGNGETEIRPFVTRPIPGSF